MNPIPTIYNHNRFRSRHEADCAHYLDTHGFRGGWVYEPESYLMPRVGHYRPDFFIRTDCIWVEARGHFGVVPLADRQLVAFPLFTMPEGHQYFVYRRDKERVWWDWQPKWLPSHTWHDVARILTLVDVVHSGEPLNKEAIDWLDALTLMRLIVLWVQEALSLTERLSAVGAHDMAIGALMHVGDYKHIGQRLYQCAENAIEAENALEEESILKQIRELWHES